MVASRAFGRNVELFVGVQNLFDAEYFVGTLPTTVGAPRLVTGGLRLRLYLTRPGGFAPPDPPSPSLAGGPVPRSAPAGRARGAPNACHGRISRRGRRDRKGRRGTLLTPFADTRLARWAAPRGAASAKGVISVLPGCLLGALCGPLRPLREIVVINAAKARTVSTWAHPCELVMGAIRRYRGPKLDTPADGLVTCNLDVSRPHLLSRRLRVDLLSMRLYDAGDARVRRL